MTFDLQKLVEDRKGENYELQEQFVNPTFRKVLKIIGFDRFYVRGEGPYLFDQEGRQYLDFICGYGVFNIGRNHPKVKKALHDYLDLDYPSLVKMDAPLLGGLLAEALVERMPASLDTVFFGNSGTEGVEASLKYARAYTGRSGIVYAKGAFHGLSYGALSVNGDHHFRERFDPFLPDCEAVPYNDSEALEEALSTGDVAAFIIEPIQGKGVHVASDQYLRDARRLCDEYGTCLIVDEVRTGIGRTGTFLAIEDSGVEPDILILSKSLSGGLVPLSAVVSRRKIALKVFDRLDRCVVHSSTFSQNGLAMAAGLATLDVLDEEKLVENSRKMGTFLHRELSDRVNKYELLKEVRGRGLLLAVEFGSPKSLTLKMGWKLLHKADPGLFSQAIIMPLLDDHQILTQVAGHNMDIVRLEPALCVGEDDLRQFLRGFDTVMENCHKFPGPVWDVGSRLVKHALKEKASLHDKVERNRAQVV